MSIARVAAIVYAVLILVVVLFQMALAAGAPWGAYAMGGAAPGQLPPAMRVGALIQAALLAAMAAVVLARAGLILPGWSRASHWLAWIAVVVTALSLVLNLLSTSAGERAIWLPTLAVLLISALIVTLSRAPAGSVGS